MSTGKPVRTYDVVVIGGGAAGVGVSIALMHAGIENFIVLERHKIGASFAAWLLKLDSSLLRFQPTRLGCLI